MKAAKHTPAPQNQNPPILLNIKNYIDIPHLAGSNKQKQKKISITCVK